MRRLWKRPRCMQKKQMAGYELLCFCGGFDADGVVVAHFNEEKTKDTKKKRKEEGAYSFFELVFFAVPMQCIAFVCAPW